MDLQSYFSWDARYVSGRDGERFCQFLPYHGDKSVSMSSWTYVTNNRSVLHSTIHKHTHNKILLYTIVRNRPAFPKFRVGTQKGSQTSFRLNLFSQLKGK